MNNEQNVPLSQIILRFFTGFGAGIAGSVILMLILFAGWSVVGTALSSTAASTNEFGVLVGGDSTHPLFVYFVLLATFLGVLAANVTYTFLFTLVEEKYVHRTTTITHSFFGNLILMILLLPAYIVGGNKAGVEGVQRVVTFHIMLSGIFTFLILESLHWSKRVLVNMYALIIGLALFTLTSAATAANPTTGTLLAMPFFFGFIGMSNSLATAVYAWIYKTYGSDVLNTDTRFGSDYTDEAKQYMKAAEPPTTPTPTPAPPAATYPNQPQQTPTQEQTNFPPQQPLQ